MKSFSIIAKNYIGAKQGGVIHRSIIDYYNSHIKPLPRGYKVTYKDNWCATFVSAIMKMAGTKSDLFECGAQRMLDKFKKNGIIVKKTKGKKDDIIFYDWQGTNSWCDHVGIIQKKGSLHYTVIEGNKNKIVGTRKILKTSKYIMAIGRVKK